jgi:hypothetical protein
MDGDPALCPCWVRIQRHTRTPLPDGLHRNGHSMSVQVYSLDHRFLCRYGSIADCHKKTGWSRETIIHNKMEGIKIVVNREADE